MSDDSGFGPAFGPSPFAELTRRFGEAMAAKIDAEIDSAIREYESARAAFMASWDDSKGKKL